jgi:hypothetical protein
MANAVPNYKTLLGCDYHRLLGSTLQNGIAAKTVKDMMPLVMDDGHFAEFVKNNTTLMHSQLRLLIKGSWKI